MIIQKDVVVTTSLALVVFTTVVFGSTMPIANKLLLNEKEEEKKVEEEAKKSRIESGSQDQASHYSELLHPNVKDVSDDNLSKLELRSSILRKYKKNSCKRYLKRFDVLIMKPIFVYKYDITMARKKD